MTTKSPLPKKRRTSSSKINLKIPKTILSDSGLRLKRSQILLDTPENRKKATEIKNLLKKKFVEVEQRYIPAKKIDYVPRMIVIYRSSKKVASKGTIGAFAPQIQALLLQERLEEALNLEIAEVSGDFSDLSNDIQDSRVKFENILENDVIPINQKIDLISKGKKGEYLGVIDLSKNLQRFQQRATRLKKELVKENVQLLEVVDMFLIELSGSIRSYNNILNKVIDTTPSLAPHQKEFKRLIRLS